MQKFCPGESYFMTKRLAAMTRSRATWRTLAVALLCAWVALAPSLAEARAGSSGAATSQGSRGSRTHSNDGAAPVRRSLTPTPSPTQPSIAPRPSPLAPAYGGGFMQQHPFMSGLMGGFIGAGLAGMLFGHSAYAADGSGFGSMLGMLLQFAVIGGLVWLAVAFFPRPGGLATAGPRAFPRPGRATAAPRPARHPVRVPVQGAKC